MSKVQLQQVKIALNLVKSGLAGSKETTDQSSCFVFLDGMVRTYNDEVSASASSPFNSFEIEGAVNSKEFLQLLGKLSGEEADIELTEGELRLKCGRSRAGIRLESEIRMPLAEIEIPKRNKSWTDLPSTFRDALRDTIFSTSRDQSVPIITAIHCNGKVVESTDDNRATRWDLKTDCFTTPLLIPLGAAIPLSRYSEIKQYARTGGWIHFRVENEAVFSCRTFDGEYPDLNPHFKVKKGKEIEFPSTVKETLECAGIFIDSDFEQDSTVQLSINEKGVLTIRGEGENGWYEETIRLKGYSAGSVAFSMNPAHLRDILSSVSTAKIGEDRVLFSSKNFLHIVALEIK